MKRSDKVLTGLVIDDEPAIHRILTDILGHLKTIKIVGHCYNTLEAIDEIKAKKPDLVFLDFLNVPYTGPEMLSKIPGVSLKAILITADTKLLESPLDNRIVAILSKPIILAELKKALSKVRKDL